MWDILSNLEKNEVLIKILVHLCKLDNKISENEYTYLIYVCDCLDINPEIIKTLANQDIVINEILPSEEMERVKILYHLLFTINADGNVSIEEENMVYQLAFKLGFHEEMTRDFLNLMKSNTIEELPEKSMINIIKKYNN